MGEFLSHDEATSFPVGQWAAFLNTTPGSRITNEAAHGKIVGQSADGDLIVKRPSGTLLRVCAARAAILPTEQQAETMAFSLRASLLAGPAPVEEMA